MTPPTLAPAPTDASKKTTRKKGLIEISLPAHYSAECAEIASSMGLNENDVRDVVRDYIESGINTNAPSAKKIYATHLENQRKALLEGDQG